MFKDISSYVQKIYHKLKLPESLVKLMPSANPQVSGYLPPAAYNIPPDVYAKIRAFKAERGLESVEMAVTVILEEYFAFTETSMESGADATTSRLETLESNCNLLSETVAELQAAIVTIQASSGPSVGYQGTPLHQHSPLPLQDKGAAAESINSPSVEQGESLEPSAVNDLQTNQSESEQLPTTETLSLRQAENNFPLSVEDIEALKLTKAIATSGSTDIGLKLPPGVQGQLDLEQQDLETFKSTPMTQADLAKRLGVATSSVSRMQSKPNFPEWSKLRDPDSVAWVKSADTKLFYPQSPKVEAHTEVRQVDNHNLS